MIVTRQKITFKLTHTIRQGLFVCRVVQISIKSVEDISSVQGRFSLVYFHKMEECERKVVVKDKPKEVTFF